MNSWPKDNRASLEAFYGTHELDPAGKPTAHWEESNLAFITPPWKMVLAWDPTQRVRVIKCHKAVRDSLARVLAAIWKHYGSQAAIEAVGLHLWGGCYEFRRVSGSESLSTHAWGAGVDINPAANPRGKPWKDKTGMMPLFVIAAFEAEGWDWGGHFRTPDAMHFQATRSAAVTMAPTVPLSVVPPGTSTVAVPSEPAVTMADALQVTKFPEPTQTVNWEGAHVYNDLGQLRQYGYIFGKDLPASPAPLSVRNKWRALYAAYCADGMRQWVRETAERFRDHPDYPSPSDPSLMRAWWRSRGFGDPAQEAGERLDWFLFDVMGGQ